MANVYCNNEKCTYNEPDQTCTAPDVFYVDRLCVTFRRKPHGDNYRGLMRTNAGLCHREHGRMKRYGK